VRRFVIRSTCKTELSAFAPYIGLTDVAVPPWIVCMFHNSVGFFDQGVTLLRMPSLRCRLSYVPAMISYTWTLPTLRENSSFRRDKD
jgi:hypothetical protein